MTSPAPKTTRAPRKPADHAPKQSEIQQANAQPPRGHDILKPVAELRSGEIATVHADIFDLFTNIGIDIDNPGDVEIETTPEVLRELGKLGELIGKYATNEQAFIALDTGRGSQQRIMELAMWYVGQLGEADESAS